MGKEILNYIGLFILLVFLQLFLFNNIQISGYINPYVYVLLILLLPYEIPGWALLSIGFITGLVVDTFMNTYGMHSSATLFMAYMRPHILNLLTDRVDFDSKGKPSMTINGVSWFLRYTIFLVLAHHFFLFFVEAFTLKNFFATILRIMVSTIATTAFIFLGQFFTLRKV